MTRAGATEGFESPRGPMSDPPADEDGRTVIPLLGGATSRRGVLAGAAALLSSSMFVRAHDSGGGHTVGGDNAVVGADYKPNLHELDQSGSLRQLVVAPRPEQFGGVQRTPAMFIALDGRWEIDLGGETSPSNTGALLTNVASIDTAADAINIGGTDAPALQFMQSGDPGMAVVLDGAPSTRSDVGGGTARINVGDTTADLPSSPPEPSVQFARDGDWEVWA